MRLLQALSYGTERYPAKVARQLRVFNFGCWSVALVWLTVAVFYLADIRLRTVVVIQVIGAVIFAAMPLLHRVDPRAAPIAFMMVAYPTTFVICAMLGTDTGLQLNYMGYAAAAALILGIDPIAPPIVFSALALAFVVALEILAPRDGGLMSEAAMLGSFIAATIGTGTVMFAVMFYAVREITRAEASAAFEYERSESLLANILPAAVAGRLKAPAPQVIADKYEEASILFADMAGFTAAASDTAPAHLVRFLNEVFTAFDRLVERHGLEKIKTTGDNYMVVSGVPVPRPDHSAALVQLALEMLDAAERIPDPRGRDVSIRIGIASGPVVAGVVGVKKFFYDVWGDAVNVASRMESTGVPGRIQVSPETYELVKDQFEFESRGPIDVKGKGRMTPWLLVAPKSTIVNSAR